MSELDFSITLGKGNLETEALGRKAGGHRYKNSLASGTARGADNLQATGYAFTQTLAQLAGAEGVEKWANDGVKEQLRQASLNPAKVASYKDIEDFSDFGSYLMDTIGEQIPNALLMAAGGAGAAGLAARAAIGKAAAKGLSKEALGQVKKAAAIQGGKAGALGATYPMTVGETQMEFNDEGIKNPLKALGVGAVNAAVEMGPLGKLIDKVTDGSKQARNLKDIISETSKTAGIQGVWGGLSEGAQTAINKYAVSTELDDYDVFSDDNIDEILESMAKGVVGQGALAGGAQALASTFNADFDATNREMQAFAETEGGQQADMFEDNEIVPNVQNQMEMFANEESANVDPQANVQEQMDMFAQEESQQAPQQAPQQGEFLPAEQQAESQPDQEQQSNTYDQAPEPATQSERDFSKNAFLQGKQLGYIQTAGEPDPEMPSDVQSIDITPELSDDPQLNGAKLFYTSEQAIDALQQGSGWVQNYGTGAKPENPTGAIVPIDSQGNEGSPILIDDTSEAQVTQAQQERSGEQGAVKKITLEELQDRINVRLAENKTANVPVKETGEAQQDMFGFEGVETPNAASGESLSPNQPINELDLLRYDGQQEFSTQQMKPRVDLTPEASPTDEATGSGGLDTSITAAQFDAELDRQIPDRQVTMDPNEDTEGEGGQGFSESSNALDAETVEFNGRQVPIETTEQWTTDPDTGEETFGEVKGIRELALVKALKNLFNKDGSKTYDKDPRSGSLPKEGFLKLAGPDGPVSIYMPQMLSGVAGESPGTLDIVRGTSGTMMTNLEQTLGAAQEAFAIIAETYGLGPKLKEQINNGTLSVAVYRGQNGKTYTLKQLNDLVNKARSAKERKNKQFHNKDHQELHRRFSAGKRLKRDDYFRYLDYEMAQKSSEASAGPGTVGTKGKPINEKLRENDAENPQAEGTAERNRKSRESNKQKELENRLDKTVLSLLSKGKEHIKRIARNSTKKNIEGRIVVLEGRKKKTIDEHIELRILKARKTASAASSPRITQAEVRRRYKIEARNVLNNLAEKVESETDYMGMIKGGEGFGLNNVDTNNADASQGNKITEKSLADSNEKATGPEVAIKKDDGTPAKKGNSYMSMPKDNPAAKTANELWGIKGVKDKGIHAYENTDKKEVEFLQKMQSIAGDETPIILLDEKDMAKVIALIKAGKLDFPHGPIQDMLDAMQGVEWATNQKGVRYKKLGEVRTNGRYIPMGDFAIVGVRADQPMADRLMIIAHEYGHLLFKKTFDDMAASERSLLREDWRKSKNPDFEEWFADQVAAYFRENFSAKAGTKDRGILGKISDKLYRGFKSIFDAVKGALPERFQTNAEFRKFMNRAIKEGAFKSKDHLGFGDYRDFGREDFAKAKKKLETAHNGQFVRNLTKVVNKLVRTGSTRLRKMGPAGTALDNIFHSLANTSDSTTGSITQSVKENYDPAKLKNYPVGKMLFDVDKNRVVEITDQVGADGDLRRYARVVKRSKLGKKVDGIKGWLEEHNVQSAFWMNHFKDIMPADNEKWNDWLKQNAMGKNPSPEFKKAMDEFWVYANARMGGKLGRVTDYFPRVYDPNAILEDLTGFKKLLVDHLVKNGNDNKTAIKKAEGITNAILSEQGVDVNTMMDDENLRTPGMENKASRILKNIPDALLEPYMAEPKYRLLNYVQSAVKRAEYEMRAGNFDSIERLEKQLQHQVAMGQGDLEFYESIRERAEVYRREKKDLRDLIENLNIRKKLTTGAKSDSLTKQIKTHEKQLEDLEQNPPEYWNPNGHVETLLEAIPEADRQDARTVVEGYMGRLGIETNATVSNLRQWIMALQYYTTLAFAALSSVTDMANILLRAKAENLTEFKEYTKLMALSFKDRKKQLEMGRALGIIQHDTIMSIISQSYGGTFQNPTVQKYNDMFFKMNGLEWLTTTTRIMSMNAGKHFLKQSALEKSRHGDKYLADLGLTAKDVKHWIEEGEPMGMHINKGVVDPRHPLNKVASALNRFVDESILRPNAAQRPTWANSQNFFAQLVWQLKSFFWAFGHTIIKGVAQDMKNRRARGDSIPQTMMPLLIGGVPLMALAALGLEMKEFIKHGTEGGASDDMGAAAYAFDLFDRSGGLGPFGIATGMLQAQEYGGSPLVSLLGPAAEHVETIFRIPQNGVGSAVERTIPYLSQTNGKFLGYNLSPF